MQLLCIVVRLAGYTFERGERCGVEVRIKKEGCHQAVLRVALLTVVLFFLHFKVQDGGWSKRRPDRG